MTNPNRSPGHVQINRHGPEDLRPVIIENSVDKTVIVKTSPSLEETAEFLSILENDQ